MAFRITTNAFVPGGNIPVSNSKDGSNKSPYIRWEDAPEGTQSFALIMEDPDVPGEPFAHWMVYDIPANVNELEDGLLHQSTIENEIHQGMNDYDEPGYGGPQPPAGERHQYVFRLYALAKPPRLEEGLSRKDLLAKINEMEVLGQTEITGFFKSLRKRRVSAA